MFQTHFTFSLCLELQISHSLKAPHPYLGFSMLLQQPCGRSHSSIRPKDEASHWQFTDSARRFNMSKSAYRCKKTIESPSWSKQPRAMAEMPSSFPASSRCLLALKHMDCQNRFEVQMGAKFASFPKFRSTAHAVVKRFSPSAALEPRLAQILKSRRPCPSTILKWDCDDFIVCLA